MKHSSYQPMLIPTNSHARRPSDLTMPSWLSRSPTPLSRPPKSVKPISEPKFTATKLGLGATVVHTPDDALRDTGVRVNYRSDPHKPRANSKRVPPLTSPPLPPLPLPEEDELRLLEADDVIDISPLRPPRPPATDIQRVPSLSKRSSLKLPKAISVTHSSSSEEPPSVPPLPSHIAASTQPPHFAPVLIAEPSKGGRGSVHVNPDKVIVSLETCSQTFRTTLSTLTSRPSHLAKYLSSLYAPPPSPNPISPAFSSSSSLYSTQSDDPNVCKHPLPPPLISTVHIFLDRPSAPYIHILSYLRQPLIDSQSEFLPYALQLHNYTSSTVQASSPSILQSRLDTLIEVRDEAAYLSLETLHKLCVEEIKNRYNPKQMMMVQMLQQGQGHIRGLSSSSLHSLHASIYNLHTLQEKNEAEMEGSPSAMSVSDSILINSSNSTASSIGQGQAHSQPAPAPSPALSPRPFSPGFHGPAGPSPAAIAIRRRSRQALAASAAVAAAAAVVGVPPLAENMVPLSRTPPTPQSLDGQGQLQQQQQIGHAHSQSQSRSPNNRSRSNSRSRPPATWI